MSDGERRLGAIMFTDVVGYSAITSQDEKKALRVLRDLGELLQSVFPNYGGKVIKNTGDGYMVEFASAVQAVNCAVDIQRRMSEFDSGPGEKVAIRIGIHVGDVVHSGGDILGDAVNVAARVQPLAEPGGISVTRQVVDQVQRKVDHKMISIGVRDLKNIQYPVEIFKVELPRGVSGAGGQLLDPRRVAVLPFTNMSPDPNDRYFADGMTEEVISTVAKISELQVISRT
jgi:adenylate cyclase